MIDGYINGGTREDGGLDLVGQNPTGRARKSSAGQRRKKIRKLFGGTAYERPEDQRK